MTARLALTGATGRVGGRVARALADLEPVLLVRDPARAPQLPGVEVRTAEYRDYDQCLAALQGVETLFFVSAQETRRRREDHRRLVMAAVDAGVGHLVYTSLVRSPAGSLATLAHDHAHTEEAILGSGLRFTFLRDNLYADALPYLVGPDGVIRGPAGEGRVAGVAIADVADAAAAVLRDPAAHAGTTYSLTGHPARTLEQVLTK